MSKTIYTWGDLHITRPRSRKVEIYFTWKNWKHCAIERNHLLEAESLWRSLSNPATIGTLLDALKTNPSAVRLADLQCLLDSWRDEFQRVFQLPRLLHCLAAPKSNSQHVRVWVLQFVSKNGVIYICREQAEDSFELATFYFPRTLVAQGGRSGPRAERLALQQ